jgi:hypothetical protein
MVRHDPRVALDPACRRRLGLGSAHPGGHGRSWFLVWGLAGFLMSFSLIAGFSIGLLLLPVAAAVVLWAALRSPHLSEAAGFLAGVGATVVLVALI